MDVSNRRFFMRIPPCAFFRVAGALAGVGFIAIIAGCRLLGGTREPLRMERVGDLSDTVSVFPALTFAFSSPLKNRTVDFIFDPPFFDWCSVLNETADTCTLTVNGELQGATRYVVRAAHELTSTSGATYSPEGDLIEVFTSEKEKEPNNTPGTADTLDRRICGTIETAADTDFYCVPVLGDNTIGIDMLDSRLGVAYRENGGGAYIEAVVQDGEIVMSGGIEDPVSIRVNAFVLEAGSRYELRIRP
jgi:hypothetical protein